DGHWPRHVTTGWMSIWDLAKPVIAQVHGFCLAGGSELATGCDLVYIAEDAQMGYPAVRFGVPDMHFHPWFLGMRKAMEMTLPCGSMRGIEAVERGWANHAYPADELDDAVIDVAERIAMVAPELVQMNKRVVHHQMDIMGLRAGIRAGTELCALGTHAKAMAEFLGATRSEGLTGALQERHAPFGDYRASRSRATSRKGDLMSVWRYDGKRVVVSGGGGAGMGAAATTELANLGAEIHVIDLKEPPVPVKSHQVVDLRDPDATAEAI